MDRRARRTGDPTAWTRPGRTSNPLSRRGFLAAAGLSAFAAPALLDGVHARFAAADTPATLDVRVANTTGSGTLYAYVVGIDPANGQWMFLQADGRTPYYPPSPSAPGAPLGADCAIPCGGGASIAMPHLVSGRVFFSIDQKLTFLVNPGPGIAMPSAANPDDPNHAIQWGFAELTYDTTQLYANISFVDFTGIPIGLGLTTPGGSQSAPGLPRGGLATMAQRLRDQHGTDGAAWDQLVVDDGGTVLRVLSPNLLGQGHFDGYLEPYVDQVWAKYAGTDLRVDTQFTWGVATGRVSGDTLTFDGVGSFTKPSTYAIFNCSAAPFTTNNDEMGNLSARLAAALNRTTLLDNADQPDADPAAYYQQAHTNHYARVLHATTTDGRGYAFPYDDVHAGDDVEGKVQSGQPGTLTITVGG